MLRSHTYKFLLLLLGIVPLLVQGQEIDYDSLLQRIDTIENPVYKPVISFSYGVLNFHGEVSNGFTSAAIGNNALSVSISTFVDKKHNFNANFFYLNGNISGNSYSYEDISRNMNFRSSISSFGVNVEYRFGHIFDKDALVRPYLSLGAGILNFSAKGDLVDANGLTYHYWSDGTIRDAPEGSVVDAAALYRDYNYETDLRLREQEEYGLGDYNQNALVIPVGIGGLFRISNRAFFSLGISYYYAVSDMVDNVAYEGTSIKGNKGNDSFIYSNLALHFDLFSDPTTRTVDLLYADVDFDPLLYDDEDGDFVLDLTDHCPGTPYGVAVDSLGCPLDGDWDGVPDYLDQELDTERDAWVNELGITVSDDEFQSAVALRENAMPREEVDEYSDMISGQYKLNSQVQIPENFQSLDTDGDGYLSFNELLLVIDKYFDFQMDLDVDEVRELNEFFFSQ